MWLNQNRVWWIRLLCFFCALSSSSHALADDRSATPSAFALFQEMAEQGQAEAQYNLGVMYETGWTVPVDYRKAVRWFRAAAEQGQAEAQLRLGMLYYLGLGARQSHIKGEKWIRKAARAGQPLAEKLQRQLFVDELPGELTPAPVLEQVRTAYLENEDRAIALLETLVQDAKRQAQRTERAKKATTLRERRVRRTAEGPNKPGFETEELERIDSAVPAFIGETSVEDNRTRSRGSIATLRLQAEKGLASAQYNLGRMYETGVKLPADKARALEWYTKAANQGFADAEYRLGITYLYGTGVPRDEAVGRRWLSLAAEHGHAVARKMAQAFSPQGTAQHGMSLAVQWYLERAQDGDAQAAFHLGKLFEHGWGVAADFSEAVAWYQRAANSGVKEAAALAEDLQGRLGETKVKQQPSWLAAELRRYGIPSWLAHPAVLLSLGLVIFGPLLLRLLRGRRRPVESMAGKGDNGL